MNKLEPAVQGALLLIAWDRAKAREPELINAPTPNLVEEVAAQYKQLVTLFEASLRPTESTKKQTSIRHIESLHFRDP